MRLESHADPESLRNSPHSNVDGWVTLAISFLALLPRIYVALAWAREPVWDGHYYHYGAARIAAGLGYSEDVVRQGLTVWKPWTHYPVGYSAFLAPFYALCGPQTWVAPLLNALAGALLVAVVHRVALLTLGRWRAGIAAVLTALHPGLIAYSAAVMTEPFAALLVLLAAYLVVRAPGRRLTLVISGLTLTAAVLVRPTSLLALPLIAFLFPFSFWRSVTRTAIIGAVCVLGVLPWTIRNCQRMDGCAFVSTNAGWNLAIGALTDTGRFRTLRAADGCPIVTGQVQQDRCWWDVGVRAIRQHPGHFLATAPLKLAQTFDHESFVIEYLHEADPAAWPDETRKRGRELLSVFHRALLVAALFCIVAVLNRKRFGSPGALVACVVQSSLTLGVVLLSAIVVQSDQHPYYWLVIALCSIYWLPLPGHPKRFGIIEFAVGFVALTALTHVAFFGEDRYHVVTTPLLCLCAAAAFGPSARRASERDSSVIVP